MAIGIGCIWPRVMSMCSSANAGAPPSDIAASAARTAVTMKPRWKPVVVGDFIARPSQDIFGIEGQRHVLPEGEFLGRQLERLALEYSTGRTLRRRAEEAVALHARLIDDARLAHRAVRIESNVDLDDEILGILRPGGHVPAFLDLLAHRIDLAHRHLVVERGGRARARLSELLDHF